MDRAHYVPLIITTTELSLTILTSVVYGLYKTCQISRRPPIGETQAGLLVELYYPRTFKCLWIFCTTARVISSSILLLIIWSARNNNTGGLDLFWCGIALFTVIIGKLLSTVRIPYTRETDFNI